MWSCGTWRPLKVMERLWLSERVYYSKLCICILSSIVTFYHNVQRCLTAPSVNRCITSIALKHLGSKRPENRLRI